MALKRIQECISLSYPQDLLDDNDFCLVYDANYTNYPVFDHGQYTRFTLDAVSEEECLSSFLFRQLDIPYLAQVLWPFQTTGHSLLSTRFVAFSDNWTFLTLHKICGYLRSSFALIELQH